MVMAMRTGINAASSGPTSMPKSSWKSRCPNARRSTLGALAIVSIASKPAKDSMRGSTPHPVASRASRACRSVTVWALGKTTPPSPCWLSCTTRSVSIFQWSVSLGLMRTMSWAFWSVVRLSNAASRAIRAAGLSVGDTASSRSMITMSAPLCSALTKRSGVVAGTNKNDRAWAIREVLAE